MRITNASEYAMRLMVVLARNYGQPPLSAEKIAERENIPRDFTHQLLLRLKASGLVTIKRGAAGGSSLAAPPERISVGDVLRAVDGRIFEDVCGKYAAGEARCAHQSGGCGIRSVWARLAALVDGFSRWGLLWRIVLPLAAPAVATTAILVFIFSWNEFLLALTFISRDDARTVPVGIAMLSGATVYEVPWDQISAAVVVTTLPVVAMVLAFQRRIIEGLTAGAVKG